MTPAPIELWVSSLTRGNRSPDIARPGAPEEKRRPQVGCLEIREALEIVQVLGNGVEVHTPHEPVLSVYQVGKQKLADGWLLNTEKMQEFAGDVCVKTDITP